MASCIYPGCAVEENVIHQQKIGQNMDYWCFNSLQFNSFRVHASLLSRVGSFFRGAVSSMEKSGFFRPGRNMFLPFLPMLLEETYLFQFSLNFSYR